MLVLLGVSAGYVCRGILVGVGRIMSFEVEYRLAANSVRCRVFRRVLFRLLDRVCVL